MQLIATPTRSGIRARAAAVVVSLASAAAPAVAAGPTITYNGKLAIPSRTIHSQICPVCILPCPWFYKDVATKVEVDASPSASLTVVKYTITDIFGNPVGQGNLPINADGSGAAGTVSPIGVNDVILGECGGVMAFTITVSATQVYNDTGLRSRSVRSHIITLRCVTCDGEILFPDAGQPYHLPHRPGPYSYDTQFSIANGMEVEHPMVATFKASHPWIVPQVGEMPITIEPNGHVLVDVPVLVLPNGQIGSEAELTMTVTSKLDPTVSRSASAVLRIGPPERSDTQIIGPIGCELPEGDCFAPHAGQGCEDVDCCDVVTAFDPYCAFHQWDEACAGWAISFCEGAAAD